MARSGLALGEHQGALLRPHAVPNFRGVAATHRTEGMWQFVCTTCGYLELHLLDEAALAFIRTEWPVVQRAP
jgi:hypothetical protein